MSVHLRWTRRRMQIISTIVHYHIRGGINKEYLPAKLISLLGWTICPFSGRNTNGICWDMELLTNGARAHSARK